VLLQGQRERPAYQPRADNRDLAKGHRFRSWDRLLHTNQATVRPTAGAIMRN
jgi:hypothetical protein